MSGAEAVRRCLRAVPAGRERGVALPEFALVAPLFLFMLFFLMELCRFLYLAAALQEVSRNAARLASVSRFDDPAAMASVRARATFGGTVPLAGGLGSSHVRIEYLSLNSANVYGTVDPAAVTPEGNIATCAANPNASSCVRFVRVQLCLPGGGACNPVPYAPLTGLLAPLFAGLHLPAATTVTPAESFGARLPCGPC